jgi:hypothetical protein
MMPKYIILFAMAFSPPMATAADFHKTYDNVAERRITIFTLHGDIKLSGYDGETIYISAVKSGPDRDRVEIVDASVGNQIHVFPRYLEPARNNATVDFEIRVPKEIFYNAEPAAKPKHPQGEREFTSRFQRFPGEMPELQGKSKPLEKPVPAGKPELQGKPKIPPAPSGKPEPSMTPAPARPRGISDVAGSIRAETGGRNIEVHNVEGMLSASSVSGDIKGLLKHASHRSVLQFSSISGNISVQAPDDISTQVRIQSSTGQVKTDFPLEMKEMRYGPGRFIQGKLGAGNHMLDIRSVSGTINFSRKPSGSKSK